jgi:hypothetical protein
VCLGGSGQRESAKHGAQNTRASSYTPAKKKKTKHPLTPPNTPPPQTSNPPQNKNPKNPQTQKSRTLSKVPTKPEELPTWNYDGSSTGQAPGDDSEVYLVPRAIYRDPFRGGDNILVMCDAYEPPRANPDGTVTDIVPIPTNTRAACAEVMAKAAGDEPWFGIEQEYTLLNALTKWPLGWPDNGYPAPQGPYYCSAGAGCAIGRDVADVHYKMCLYAGINVSGVNAEVMPAQWEYQVGLLVGLFCLLMFDGAPAFVVSEGAFRFEVFFLCFFLPTPHPPSTLITFTASNPNQPLHTKTKPKSKVGPCVGIDGGDQLWMSRYIMYRVAEIFNVDVSFDPKPIPGDWNGAGGHVRCLGLGGWGFGWLKGGGGVVLRNACRGTAR